MISCIKSSELIDVLLEDLRRGQICGRLSIVEGIEVGDVSVVGIVGLATRIMIIVVSDMRRSAKRPPWDVSTWHDLRARAIDDSRTRPTTCFDKRSQ